MEENEKVLAHIVKYIRETGSDPRDQITGYVRSGDERYITRSGNARDLIKILDNSQLEQYISNQIIL